MIGAYHQASSCCITATSAPGPGPTHPHVHVSGGRASILVSEIFGEQPLSESVLPTFAHAQRHLLEASAIIIPSRIRIIAALAHITGLPTLACCPPPHLAHYNTLIETPLSLCLANHHYHLLTPPTCVGEIDLTSIVQQQGHLESPDPPHCQTPPWPRDSTRRGGVMV